MRFIRPLATSIALFGFAGNALAQSSNDTFVVSAEVIDACNLTANDLDFGNYSSISGNYVDATTTLDVTCTNGTSYTVELNVGTTTGATFTGRLLTDTTNTLEYNLYTTSGRTTVWGDGSGATQTMAGTGNGSLQSLTVYGRIPASQAMPVGSYTDTITAEVSF